MTDTASGGISAGGRFDRIEASLARIENKLDTKADVEDLKLMDVRVQLLESGQSPLGKILLEQFNEMQRRVNELVLHGSENAQAQGRRLAAVESDVASVKTLHVANEHTAQDRLDREAKFLRWWGWAISAFVLAMTVISFARP